MWGAQVGLVHRNGTVSITPLPAPRGTRLQLCQRPVSSKSRTGICLLPTVRGQCRQGSRTFHGPSDDSEDAAHTRIWMFLRYLFAASIHFAAATRGTGRLPALKERGVMIRLNIRLAQLESQSQRDLA